MDTTTEITEFEQRRDERRREWIAGMRAICDLLDAHPEIDIDYGEHIHVSPYRMYVPEFDDTTGLLVEDQWSLLSQGEQTVKFLGWVRKAAKALRDGAEPGQVEKVDSDYDFGAQRRFGPHVLRVRVPKSTTCESVPKLDDDGEPIVKRVRKTTVVELDEYNEVPVMETRCPKLALSADDLRLD